MTEKGLLASRDGLPAGRDGLPAGRDGDGLPAGRDVSTHAIFTIFRFRFQRLLTEVAYRDL
jgi:hypothetical protein